MNTNDFIRNKLSRIKRIAFCFTTLIVSTIACRANEINFKGHSASNATTVKNPVLSQTPHSSSNVSLSDTWHQSKIGTVDNEPSLGEHFVKVTKLLPGEFITPGETTILDHQKLYVPATEASVDNKEPCAANEVCTRTVTFPFAMIPQGEPYTVTFFHIINVHHSDGTVESIRLDGSVVVHLQ